FFLKCLEQFKLGAGLAGSVEPVGRAGRGNKHANDAPLDHPIEVTRPRLEGWALYQLLLRLRLLILREGGQAQRDRDTENTEKDMLHEGSEVCLVYLDYVVCLVTLREATIQTR